MYFKLLLTASLLLIATEKGHTQGSPTNIIDSLRQVLQHASSASEKAFTLAQISIYVSESNPDSGLALANNGIALTQGIHNDTAFAFYLNAQGWAYFRRGQNDSAINYLTRAVNILKKLNCKKEECSTLLNLTAVFDAEDNSEKELSYLMEVLPLVDSLHDLRIKAVAEVNIGNVYNKLGNSKKAMDYLQKGIASSRLLHNDFYLSDPLITLGLLYISLKQYDSALLHFREALSINKRIKNVNGQAIACENIGDVFLNKAAETNIHPYADSALYYFELAAAAFKDFGNKSDIAYENLNIGKAFALLNEKNKAIEKLTDALSVFKSGSSYNYAYEAASVLSNIYSKQKDFEKAFDYLRQSDNYKKIIDSLNEKKTIDNLLIKYETDKKEHDIQLLNAQKDIADKKLQRDKIILIFSFGFIALLIFTGIIFLQQWRIRQQLRSVQIRNRIAGDLHDDIGSSLSSIFLLSNMAQQKDSGPVYQSTLQKISNNAKELMDKMNDIVWTMKPGNDDGTNLKEKLEKLLQVPESSGIHVQADIDEKLSNIKFTMEARKNIFLISKEAINNILKHAQASCISMSLSVVKDAVTITITDNGKGFDVGSAVFNNGMDTMSQRARDCGGNFSIESAPGQGSTVQVLIPLPKNRYAFLHIN